jgi:hypothetical protein
MRYKVQPPKLYDCACLKRTWANTWYPKKTCEHCAGTGKTSDSKYQKGRSDARRKHQR